MKYVDFTDKTDDLINRDGDFAMKERGFYHQRGSSQQIMGVQYCSTN